MASNDQIDDCNICQQIKDPSGRPISSEHLYSTFHADCPKCSTRDTKSQLCPSCQHLRIPHLVLCLESENGIGRQCLGTLREVRKKSSTCLFCRICSHAVSTHGMSWGIDEHDLLESTVNVLVGLFQGRINVYYQPPSPALELCAIVAVWAHREDGTSPSASKPENERPFLGRHVDWERTRLWMNSARQTSNQVLEEHSARWPSKLKVIDVQQNRVIEAPPDCTYLALSYVFGNVKIDAPEENGTFSRQSLPKTIQDALVACQMLEVPYLWVDQLCINQKDAIELQEQINQMDRIYRRAKCTLVAAAGDNSAYGLPGVTTPRTWNHCIIEIDNLVLADYCPDLQAIFPQSTWSKRGWTFQETVLSSKLVLFTEYGVYFARAGDSGWDIETEATSDQYQHRFQVLPALVKFHNMLQQYSQRSLSYDADILRAFTPILHALHGADTYLGLRLQHIDDDMTWYPANDRAAPIDTRQREGFPSWSWTSHAGPIKHSSSNGGLAIWGTIDQATRTVTICKPALNKEWGPGWRSIPDAPVDWLMTTLLLCWREGCVESRVFPVEPNLDSVTVDTLSRRWPTYDVYWDDMFGQFAKQSIFSPEDIEIASSTTSRILVRGQTAHFYTESAKEGQPFRSDETLWIRSSNGTFAGTIRVPQYHQQSLQKHPSREFLLLSIGHPHSADVTDAVRYTEYPSGYPEALAAKGIDDLLYHDGDGNVFPPLPDLDEFDDAPKFLWTVPLNVMLIERDENTVAARRLGVGHIFLKRWAEAHREFKTIILE